MPRGIVRRGRLPRGGRGRSGSPAQTRDAHAAAAVQVRKISVDSVFTICLPAFASPTDPPLPIAVTAPTLSSPFSYVHVLDVEIAVPPEGVCVTFAAKEVTAGSGMALALILSRDSPPTPGAGGLQQHQQQDNAIQGLPPGTYALLLLPPTEPAGAASAPGQAGGDAFASALKAAGFSSLMARRFDPRHWQLPAGPSKQPLATPLSLSTTTRAAEWSMYDGIVKPSERQCEGGETIVGLGVVCWMSGAEPSTYKARLGYVSLAAASGVIPNVAASSSLQAAISNVHWASNPSAKDSDASMSLSCDVTWEPRFDRRGIPMHSGYHVWARLEKGDDASGSSSIRKEGIGKKLSAVGMTIIPPIPSEAPTTGTSATNSSGDSSSWDPLNSVPGSSGRHLSAAVGGDCWEHLNPVAASAADAAVDTAFAKVEGEHLRQVTEWEAISPSTSIGASPRCGGWEALAAPPAAVGPSNNPKQASQTSAQSAMAPLLQQQGLLYLGHALASVWAVRGMPLPAVGFSGVSFAVQPVSSADGLVNGFPPESAWATVSFPSSAAETGI